MPNKESPKKNINMDNFVKDIKAYFKKEVEEGDITRAWQRLKAGFRHMVSEIKKAQNVAKNNYDLGKKHYENGNFSDAVMRFRLVTWLEPKQAMGWLWLGKSYMAGKDILRARGALFKALELKPDLQEATDLLKAASVDKK